MDDADLEKQKLLCPMVCAALRKGCLNCITHLVGLTNHGWSSIACKLQLVLVHFDDIIIFSWNADIHISHVFRVLLLLDKICVALNIKFEIFQ